jgi:hypothetical protein
LVREDSIIQECSPREGQKSHSPTLQRGKTSLARQRLAHKAKPSRQDLSSLKADCWSVLLCCARTPYTDKLSKQSKHQVSSTEITSFFISSLPNLCFVTLDSEVHFSASLESFYILPPIISISIHLNLIPKTIGILGVCASILFPPM